MHILSSTFFFDSSNLIIRIKSNQQMNHAMATCRKQADHICAQDLISTLFGNHAQCKFNLHLTLTYFPPLIVCVAYLLVCYFIWRCAMALVHHRFKRVFYAFPNPVNGALGGVYRLHGEKSLNHHYNVFRISVPDAYLNGLNDGSKQRWCNRTSCFQFSWRMDPWVSVLQHGCHFWYKGFRVQIRLPW